MSDATVIFIIANIFSLIIGLLIGYIWGRYDEKGEK